MGLTTEQWAEKIYEQEQYLKTLLLLKRNVMLDWEKRISDAEDTLVEMRKKGPESG